MKNWVITEIFIKSVQRIMIQPTPGFDGISVSFKEEVNKLIQV